MAAPTLAASYLAGTVWTGSTSPLVTASINRAVGDVLVAVAMMEDVTNGANSVNVADNTGITWTRRQEVITGSRCYATIWTAVASSAANTTISFSEGTATTLHWGARVFHFTGSDGIGTSNKGDAADSAPSVTLTGVLANSAIVMGFADWEAGGGAATYRTADAGTFTQTDAVDDGNFYSIWAGRYADAGASGNKTVGATAPSAPDWSLVAVEVKGSTAGATDLVPANIAQGRSSDAPTLTQVHVLTVANIAQARGPSTPTLTQVHVLTVANIAQARSAENVTVTTGAVDLVPANIAQARSSGAPALTQVHVLTVAAIAQARSTGAPALTQVHVLTVAAVVQARTTGAPALTQVHVLTAAAIAQARGAENVTLSSAVVLAPANVAQARNSGAPALTQVHVLTVATVAQARSSGVPALTQLHQIAAAALLWSRTTQTATVVHVTGVTAPAERRMYVAPQVRRLVAPTVPDVLVYDFRELSVRR